VSFILDALRKSENERQRSAVPGFSHVPFAMPRHRLPSWAIAAIVILGVCVLALGGAWWSSSRSGLDAAPAVATPAPTVNVPIDIPAPRSIEQRGTPTTARTLNNRATRRLANLIEEPESAAANAAAELPNAVAAEQSRSTSAWQTLPSAAELAAEGITVPTLRLELHVFYPDRPADRFVIINGSRYREGEVTTQGPRVVTIESTGAVLSHQGREFLLSPE